MNIIEQIESEYRSSKNYGIQFSIDPEAYKCNLPEERVEFGENISDLQCGTFYNWQDVLIDGNVVGYLEESRSGRMLHPTTVSFCVFLADCSEPEKITPEIEKNPHFRDEGEAYVLKFATLQQMVDYLKIN
ncbi:MAG: hypothetical protein PUC18_13180 [Prevotellaceae bacterium]|nr:hypothetical protein [Prevotellaceae bacterium]